MTSPHFTLLSSLTVALLGPCLAAGLAHAQGSAARTSLPFAPGRVSAAWPAGGHTNGQGPVRAGAPAPASSLSPEQRADLFMARKMFREAIETYGRIEPVTAVTLNKIGIAYQQQCDHAEARKYYQRAIKAQSNFAEAINNLGTLYYSQRSYRRATALYKRALALQPLSATIHINLGMAFLARHNDAEWQRHLRRALELDPGILERRGGYGVMIEERNTTERAKFDFYMARIYAKSGKNELALQYIRKALECGFKDRKKLLEDEDFAAVRQLPEFDELMKQPPKVL